MSIEKPSWVLDARVRSLARSMGAAALVSASACAPVTSQWPSFDADNSTLVEVRNDRWDDLTVYIDRAGTLLRLSVVPGLTTRVLTVPDSYLPRGGPIRLMAKQPGARTAATSAFFTISPGQRAAWIAARTSGPTGVAVR